VIGPFGDIPNRTLFGALGGGTVFCSLPGPEIAPSDFRFWLDSEVRAPEIDFRFSPNIRHSGRGPPRPVMVESGCGAVAVGLAYQFPPLSSGGASIAEPLLRFHTPLIEPDVRY